MNPAAYLLKEKEKKEKYETFLLKYLFNKF